MPTITLSKKALLAASTKKRTDEELKDRIAFLGTDLEHIKGDEIAVEIFPSRPDLLSQQGFNRAFTMFVGDAKPKTYTAKKPRKDARVIIEPAVKDVRPYTACAIVSGLHLDDQAIKDIIQIQEKLHVTYGRNRKRCAIGIYPLEHITLPITYTAKKPQDITFTPLEGKKPMTGLQILSQHPTGRDYGHLLEGKEQFPLFIDAAGEILSMPPIINSERTGRITEKTTEAFIECSGFSWHVVHGAIAMIVTALADMGGTIEEMTLEYPKDLGGKRNSPQLSGETMTLETAYANKYMGYELSDTKIAQLLIRMGMRSTPGKKKGTLDVHVPAYRTDILHPIDLVEDIAIAYGTDNVEAVIPNVATIGAEDGLESFKQQIRSILTGCGLIETKNYNLTSKESQTVQIGEPDISVVQVASASSQEYDTLRRLVLPSSLQTLRRNKHHEYPQNIFEIGDVFGFGKNETGVEESTHLAVALCGDEANYTAARQILDALCEALDVPLLVTPAEEALFIRGRVGYVAIQGKTMGLIGEVSPETLTHFELDMPVAGFELDLELLRSCKGKDISL